MMKGSSLFLWEDLCIMGGGWTLKRWPAVGVEDTSGIFFEKQHFFVMYGMMSNGTLLMEKKLMFMPR
jgi:hypothetical protein